MALSQTIKSLSATTNSLTTDAFIVKKTYESVEVTMKDRIVRICFTHSFILNRQKN